MDVVHCHGGDCVGPVFVGVVACRWRQKIKGLMMQGEQLEQSFLCPYCGSPISMLLDPSASRQEYVEDCEVCCRPIEIEMAITEDGDISFFEARRAQD